jgi:hypothetical protein
MIIACYNNVLVIFPIWFKRMVKLYTHECSKMQAIGMRTEIIKLNYFQ